MSGVYRALGTRRHTPISRLKSKFVRQLGERLAEHYIIRQENGRYLISLPRTLVTWESEKFGI